MLLGAIPADCTLTAPESAFDTWEGGPWQLDEAARMAAARDLATRKRALLLQYASTQVAVLQDAVDLQIASDAEVLAVQSWKTYRILLNRVDSMGAELAEGDWPTSSDPAAADRYLLTNG